jgi:hypothetical protein
VHSNVPHLDICSCLVIVLLLKLVEHKRLCEGPIRAIDSIVGNMISQSSVDTISMKDMYEEQRALTPA